MRKHYRQSLEVFRMMAAITAAVLAAVSQNARAGEDPISPLSAAAKAKPAEQATVAKGEGGTAAGALNLETFLDRLMMAESGGKANARNPRSTALGPYQFIASTWLMIAHKHFAKDIEGLRPDQVLALRTDLKLARRAAEIYSGQNAAYLVAQGHKATFTNLRLAFLVGAGAAARILSAPAETSASELLGATVIGANPFMSKLSAQGLIARAARDIAAPLTSVAGLSPDPAMVRAAALGGTGDAKPAKAARPRIAVDCNLALPSCRRWLVLAERRISKQRRASR